MSSDTALKAESVDLHIDDNRTEHHTSEYEHETLLVRRGQQFKVTVTFNRPYDESQDFVVLQFVTGEYHCRHMELELTELANEMEQWSFA